MSDILVVGLALIALGVSVFALILAWPAKPVVVPVAATSTPQLVPRPSEIHVQLVDANRQHLKTVTIPRADHLISVNGLQYARIADRTYQQVRSGSRVG